MECMVLAPKNMNADAFCCVLKCRTYMSVLKYNLLRAISYLVYVRTLMTERYDEFVIIFKYDIAAKGSISLIHRARKNTDDSSCKT